MKKPLLGSMSLATLLSSPIYLMHAQAAPGVIPKLNPQPNAAGVVAIRSWDATLGNGISWEAGAKYLLFNGSSSGSEATWTAKGLENISYDVNLLLRSVPVNSAGKRIQLQVGSEVLEHTLAETTGDFTNIELGAITPGAGEHAVTLKGLDGYSENLMEVYRVVLTPSNIQRWWDPLAHKWRSDRVPHILGGQWHNGNGNFFTPAPQKDVDDARLNRKGYAIVTTEALKSNLTKLNAFIAHKESLGFTVHVVTENDHGGGHGVYAADNIRKWLRDNYESKDLLYVLMLGDADPYFGDVPMALGRGGMSRFERQAVVDAGEVEDWYEYTYGMAPTDHYYVDLVNETIDADGDGQLYNGGDGAQAGDKGFSSEWSVLVGRIQYAGPQSSFGKYSDVDAILQKCIDYENETDTSWRYRPDVNDTTWNINGAVYEYTGVEYRVRGRVGMGYAPTDFFQWQNNYFLTNYDIGYIRTGGHGTPTWTEGGLSVDLARKHGNNVRPFLSEIGSCEGCEVGYDNNLCASELRYGSIGIFAGTRPIASLGGNNGYGEPYYRQSRFDLFTKGESQGLAHWARMLDGHNTLTGSNIFWTLNGDPSIKVIPQAMKPTYPIIARPTQEVAYDWDGNGSLPVQEYDITNNTDASQDLTIASDSPWLSIDTTSVTLAPGQTVTITAAATSAVANLNEDGSTAHIYISEQGGYTAARKFNFYKRTPQVDSLIDFDHVAGGQAQTLGTSGGTVSVTEAAVVAGGVNGNGYDTSIDSDGLFIGTDVIPSPRHHSMTLSFWFNAASTITSDVKLLKGATGGREANYDLDLDIINSGTGLRLDWPNSNLSGAMEWNDANGKYTNEGNVGIVPGFWHQVTIVIEAGGTNKLFFDGLLVDSADNVGFTHNFDSLVFGNGFDGKFDEIQNFNYALDDAQVQAMYQRTAPMPVAPAYDGVVAAGDVQFNWTPVSGAASYELFISANKADVDNVNSGLSSAWTGTATEIAQTVSEIDQVFWRVDAILSDATRVQGATSNFRKAASGYVANTNRSPVVTQSVIDLGTIEGSKAFGPVDLSQYFSDPEGGELLVFHKDTVTGTYGPFGGAFLDGMNVHGSGQMYSNEGVTSAGQQTMNLKVVDDRGQETFFDVTYYVEQPPQIATTSLIIPENTAVNAVVATLEATDVEGDAVTFSAVSGDALNHIAVAADGTVTLTAAVDYETKSSYSFIARATDAKGYSADQYITVSIGYAAGVPLASSHATSFEEATLAESGISQDVPDSGLASITLDDTNDRLVIATTGNTDMWTSRNNGPIAFIETPLSKSWAVETEVEVDAAQNRQIAGLTVYADEDGARPHFTYGLDYWSGGSGLINLQGLGTNDPLINVSAQSKSKVKLRMEFIENGNGEGVDRYTFLYDLLDGNGMQELTSYGFSVDNDRIGLFLKTADARTAYFDNFEVFEDIIPAAADVVVNVFDDVSVGGVVATVVAKDPESDPLTYQITDGNSLGLFTIDSNGRIKLADALDSSAVAQHVLTVLISDGTYSDTVTVTINVADAAGTAITGVHDGVDLTTLGISYSNGTVETILDGNSATSTNTWNSNGGESHSYAGQIWGALRTDDIVAVEVDLVAFVDGGWFGVNNASPAAGSALVDPTHVSAAAAPIIQVTTDGGTTWATIATTSNYLSQLTGQTIGGGANPNPTALPTIRFDFAASVTNINGVRVIGSEGGSASGGFVGFSEFRIVTQSNTAPTANDATFAIAENGATNAAVGSVTASDPEGNSLTYTITAGNAAGLFAIDSSGAITATAALDFETASQHVLTVEVSDGEFTDTATITVNVSNVNEAPVASDIAGSVNENLAGGQVIGTVSVTDPDAGDTVSFAITGGNASGHFAIASNGQVTTTGPLNFESASSYALTVEATDAGGLKDTATVNVIVGNVNEAPTASDLTASIAENSNVGTVVGTLAASDPDGDSLNYQITDGSGAGLFAIASNGQITGTGALDHETTSQYTLNVQVSDAAFNDSAVVTINVTDVNEAPSASDLSGSVAEGLAAGQVIGSVVATDPEGDAITYQITGGNASGLFAIDANGQITTTGALDFDAASQHTLTVEVSDSALTDIATVTVDVTEDALNITSQGTAIGGVHNGADLTTLGVAIDSNHSGSVADMIDNDLSDTFDTYNSVNGSESHSYVGLTWAAPRTDHVGTIELDIASYLDGGWFGVNNAGPGAGGVLADPTHIGTASLPVVQTTTDGGTTWTTVASTSDYLSKLTGETIGGGANPNPKIMPTVRFDLDTPVTGINGIRVIGTEGGTASGGFLGIAELNVFASANTAPTADDATFAIAENGAANDVLGSVTATDPEGDSLTYQITAGNDAGLFAIDSSGKLTATAALDYEAASQYVLTVEVSDGSLTDTATVTVNVTDVNEAPTASNASATLAENGSAGAAVATVAATDPENDTLSYAITAGNDTGLFAIDSNGNVTTTGALDFEAASQHVLTVEVSDSALNDTATVTVDVTNANEAPVASDLAGSVNENLAGGQVIGTVGVTDPDAGDTFGYAITSGNELGLFAIDANGQITTTAALDFETASAYALTIEVTDAAGLKDTATANVTVGDVNEAPSASDFAGSVAENGAAGAVVGTVATSDPEGDALNYQITGGNASGLFAIAANGQITTTGALDHETASQHVLSVEVSDSVLTDTATVTVNVTDVNEAPVASNDVATVNEDSSVEIAVLGNDADVDSALSVASVSQGANGSVVTNGTTVTYTPNPEFYGNDSFTYTVTDGEFTDTATVNVTVNQVHADLAVGDVIAVDLASVSGNAAKFNLMSSGAGTLAAGSVVKYLDGTTVADNVSVTLENVYNAGGDDGNSTWAGTAADPYLVEEADDIVYQNPTNPIKVTFSGLDDSLTYNARVYALYDDNGGATDTYTVTNGASTVTSVMARADRKAAATLEEAGGVFNYITTDGSGNIEVSVQVTAGSGWSAFSAVVLEVVELNTAPTADDAIFVIAENGAVNSAVGSVTANDPEGDALTYAITAGNDSNLFAIDTNGQITATAALDHEVASQHVLTVEVSDGEFSDTTTITVNVSDVNEAPSASDLTASIIENGSAGEVVGTVAANDPDGDTLSYQITGGNASGLFAIDSNGQVTTTGALDYESATQHVLTVEVSDGTLTETATVTVDVNDVVEVFAPVIATGAASNIDMVSADAGYSITDEGGETPTVTIYYGLTDGGQSSLAWDNSRVIGAQTAGNYIEPLTGLTEGTSYYYTISAANSAGTVWGSTANFTTMADTSPKMVRTTVSAVSSSGWTTVDLGQNYNSAVIVATPIYPVGTATPVVTRIRNVSGSSFELKLDRADGQTAEFSLDVSVVAVEEGVYTLAADGVQMEAVKFTSTVTADNNNWAAEARTYQNSYTTPVVVGQVMSYNDANWSTFWSMGSSRTNPVDAANLNVGKHVAEDPNAVRADETIGYIVIEAGTGNINGVGYEAGVTADTIRGLGDSATPYSTSLSGTLSSASVAAASITSMDGNNGAWAVLSGDPAITTSSIGLHAVEDQMADTEMKHTTTQACYLIFE